MVLSGKYPPHEGNVLAKHASIVLLASGFERLAYYTISGSLTVWFQRELGMQSVTAQQMQATFQSIVYMMPILGAFIADTWTGRFKIVSVALGLSSIGAAGMLAGQATHTNWLSLLSLFLLFSAPVAMVKPNLIVLGADQFNEKKADQMKQRDDYFGAFYWMTNIAAAIAFLVMAQIAVEGMGAVDKSWSFSFVFGCGLAFLIIAFVALMGGNGKIYAAKPAGSALVGFFKVTMGSIKNAPTKKGIIVLSGIGLLFASVIASIPSFFVDAPALDYILAVLIVIGCVLLIVFGQSSDWVGHCEVNAPGVFDKATVQGAKDVWRLTPYIAFVIPFWSIYNQMNTSFITQGCQMDNRVGSGTISPSTMPTFNSIVIVIIIPIFNYGIYPCMGKLAGGKYTLTPLRRIALGFFASAMAMLAAACIEYSRRAADVVMTECADNLVTAGWCTADQLGDMVPELSSCYTYTGADASEVVPKHHISLFLQICSYGLVGLAEILVAITYYDFFYSQVPPFMRSVCQSIQMLTTSLGTMVGAVINSLCKAWLPNNLDNGHQESMYFVNMVFALIMLGAFAFVSRGFEYKPGTSLLPGDDAVRGGSDDEHSHHSSVSHKEGSHKKVASNSSSSSEE